MQHEQFINQVVNIRADLSRFLIGLCCGDSMLADDIAQEALIKAYLAIDKIENQDKFKSWVFRIAYNTFINNKRNRRLYLSEDELKSHQSRERSDDYFRYEELYMALNELPVTQRSVILLYYLQNYSVKEIASILTVSEDSVRQHMTRGRQQLKKLLTSN
ncbi:MAG: RNA polymerase sigma factor [Muribaculaceae bacterium]|nr:RNA polymerase sigma factor [Muribaculaceae bacterium]